MKDEACICFLQWALPHLHMRWQGFRKVRGQVCKRLGRRLDELLLPDLKNYRMYLENNPPEWHILDAMCRITISRFYRDQGMYKSLRSEVFPELIKNARQRGDKTLSCRCIGAALRVSAVGRRGGGPAEHGMCARPQTRGGCRAGLPTPRPPYVRSANSPWRMRPQA